MRKVCGVMVVMGAALVMAACDPNEADRQSLERGFTLYQQRQVEESEAAATHFIEANALANNIDEAYYLRGISRLTRGGAENRRAAAEDLRTAIEKSQRNDLKAKAYRALGDISFEAGQWADAQELYKKSLGMMDEKAAGAAFVQFRIGACLQALGQWAEATPWFEKVAASKGDAYLTERAIARKRATAFGLQFGAFQERPNADDLLTKMKAASVAAQIDAEFREGKFTYFVRYGSFHTYAEAEAARDRFLARYPVVAIIP